VKLSDTDAVYVLFDVAAHNNDDERRRQKSFTMYTANPSVPCCHLANKNEELAIPPFVKLL